MNEENYSKTSHLNDSRCDTFKDRINMLSKELGGSSQLARLSNVSESVVRKWKAGTSEPTLSRLKAIAEAGGVSVQWLATGEEAKVTLAQKSFSGSSLEAVNQSFDLAGLNIDHHWHEMVANIADQRGLDSSDINKIASLVRSEADISSEFALIPGYHVEVSAGPGRSIDEEKPTRYLAFRHKWLRFRQLKAENLALVFARGDSMEPTIHDNNTLMIDTSKTKLVDGSIYVIRTDNHLVVKRVQKLINKGVLLLSDNKEYEKQELEPNEALDLAVIGKVVWIGKDV